MPKPAILFLIDDFLGPEGGTEQHLLFLQRTLPRSVFDLYFCVLTRIDRMRAEDFPIRPLMLNDFPRGSLGRLRRLRSLAALITTSQIDVVHAFGFHSELDAWMATRLAGRGKVLGVRRSIGYWETPRSRWTARASSFLDIHYAANCEAAREFAARSQWIDRRRVTVIPNPAPAARLRDGLANLLPRSALGAAADEQIVGMVATVRPVKDYATFLRAARLVLDRRGGTRFVAIGTADPVYQVEMTELARQLRIDHRFSWLGPLDNPLTAVGQFDAVRALQHVGSHVQRHHGIHDGGGRNRGNGRWRHAGTVGRRAQWIARARAGPAGPGRPALPVAGRSSPPPPPGRHCSP